MQFQNIIYIVSLHIGLYATYFMLVLSKIIYANGHGCDNLF